jgi:hypothetical protein
LCGSRPTAGSGSHDAIRIQGENVVDDRGSQNDARDGPRQHPELRQHRLVMPMLVAVGQRLDGGRRQADGEDQRRIPVNVDASRAITTRCGSAGC